LRWVGDLLISQTSQDFDGWAEFERRHSTTQNGEARAVLVDIESYQDMQNAFSLMKILQLSERQIAAGNFKSAEQVFSEIEARLGI